MTALRIPLVVVSSFFLITTLTISEDKVLASTDRPANHSCHAQRSSGLDTEIQCSGSGVDWTRSKGSSAIERSHQGRGRWVKVPVVVRATALAGIKPGLPETRRDAKWASHHGERGHAVTHDSHPAGTLFPDSNGNLIRVSTAVGIDITVKPSFASRIQAFIADAKAQGYVPKRIHCYSLAKSHVHRSLHKTGEACDFNQHGWNKTDRFMYRVSALARKHGLRDGCSFGDCGHIDSGRFGFDISARTAPRHARRKPVAQVGARE